MNKEEFIKREYENLCIDFTEEYSDAFKEVYEDTKGAELHILVSTFCYSRLRHFAVFVEKKYTEYTRDKEDSKQIRVTK